MIVGIEEDEEMEDIKPCPFCSSREIIMADGDYICPVCNQGKMILTGRKTLGFPVDKKAYCPLCLHEEEF